MSQLIDLASVSRYAGRVLAARPELGAELAAPAPFTRAQMAQALEGAKREDEAAFKRRLRRLRERVRYAWIKARALTGAGHDELGAIVRPFVYRKYLDFATLDAMRRLHAEVRRDVERRELAEHVKLGPGGIREIEFVAQALQLVRGGRDRALTARPTLQVLELLAERNHLPRAAATELGQAYVFLRRTEHALQYLDDAQRHDLPEDAEDRGRIARMMGFDGWNAFAAELAGHREAVARHFGNV